MKLLQWTFLLLVTHVYAVDVSFQDKDVEEYFKEKLDAFKIKLHEAFERARLQRHKRNVIAPNSPDYGVSPQDHLRVVGTKSVDLGIHLGNVSYWEPTIVAGATFVVVATRTGQVELFRWTNGRYVVFTGINTSLTTTKVKAFVYGDQLWLVCLHQQHGSREQFVRLYQLHGQQLVTKQTIQLGGESDIDVVRGATAHFLVTCMFRSYSGSGTSYNGKLVLYQWKNTQFDAVSQHSVVGAKSVVAWSMDGPLYIAVAQQRDNAGEFFLGSPVFIYNQRREHELSYVQVIRFWQAFKVNHFTVASIHYLTFLTKQAVFLYWYAGDQFLEWQTLLNTEDAEDVSVFTLPNGEAAIAVVRRDEVMFFLETESSTYNCTFTLKMSGMALSSVVFQFIEGYYFMFATQAVPSAPQPPQQLVLQKYSFVAHGKPDPLLECLHNLEASLSRRKPHVDHLAANIGRVWTSSGQKPLATELVVIDGPVRVTGSVTAPKAVIVPGAQRVPTLAPSDVSRQIDEVESGVAKMENDLKNVVFKSVPQTIQGNLNFDKPVRSSAFRAGLLVDTTLNGVPVADMLGNTLKVTGDQVLNIPVSFADLYVNNLDVHAINGINISAVMMTNKDQLITGSFKFGHVSLTDLNVQRGRTINGIDPEKIVTTNTPQVIHGRKAFARLRVPGDLKVATTTNNNDLSVFVGHLVPLQGITTVTGEWTFEHPFTAGSALNLKNSVNGLYSISKLYSEAVDKHSHQTIHGPKTYKAPVVIRGNMEVSGTLNGIRPSHDLVTLHTPQDILGTWVVKDRLHFKRNLNAATINGLDIARDAVLRSKGPQVVFGRKIFDSDVVVAKDIAMTPGSTIDGVDPSELGRTTGVETVYNSAVNIESMVVIGNVVAHKGINDHMLRDLQNLIWLKSADQHIKAPVGFKNVHMDKDLDTETINGINLDEDLMKTFGDEVLEGPVVFRDSVQAKEPIAIAPGVKVNGIDLSEAARLVSRAHQNTVVHGDVSFPSIVVQKDLHCETVNGKSLSKQFLLVNGEQVVAGVPSFMQPISAKDIIVDFVNPSQLNGVPFKEFVDELVLQNASRHQLITNKHFSNGLEAHHLQSYGLVDGVNIEEMASSVVLLNLPQQVDGIKVFQSRLRLESLLADQVNSVDIREHVRRVVRRNVQQVISGKKTILGKAFVHGHVTAGNLVNGVNMKDLYGRAMSKTQENLISAPMTFLGGVEARRLHLYEPAKLDGLDLKNVVQLRDNEVLGGTVVFKNLLSDGDIVIHGLLNGCNITKLYKDALYNSGLKQTVYNRKHFSKMIVKGNVHVLGDVNGVQFDALIENFVTKNTPQTLDGPVTFAGKVAVDSLILSGPINGVNLTDMLRDAVTKSAEQVIRGTKTFTNQHGLVVSNTLHVHGNVQSRGPVGGISVADLASIVTAHGRHVIQGKKVVTGTLTADNVIVKGKLNGLRIPEDLVLSRLKHQHISGKVILAGPAAIQGNLNLNRVNNLYLEQLLTERVTLSSDQRVRSRLVFQRDVPVHGDMGAERINGILREHLVTQSGEYQLSGAKTFVQDVEIGANLNALSVNGFNLVELSKDIVLSNRPEEIPHSTVFLRTH
uniref:Putative secreted protein n=1 Tax=Amblyomma triste TaxID=251400 RepID=A0A023G4S2_AMBTT